MKWFSNSNCKNIGIIELKIGKVLDLELTKLKYEKFFLLIIENEK